MKLLVTGAAGFVGAALCARLLASGHKVVGVDNLNTYYDPRLKNARLALLKKHPHFKFFKADIIDQKKLNRIFKTEKPARMMHLAAQAGVRYSVENPHAYIDSNILGFLNILESCRHSSVEHLVYASTSSVYGLSTQLPFSEHHDADHPVSLYGATKRANELMAHSYSHLYKIPTTSLRFFTVYGPWGRPDMALFLFTKNILSGKPIPIFNHGKHRRDFTYIDDIVEGIVRVLTSEPPRASTHWDSLNPDPATSSAPFKIYNIGNNQTVELSRYIAVLEKCLGKKAKKKSLPMQMGDVVATEASIEDLSKDYGYRPQTPIETGIARFVEWYRKFYKV